MMKKMCLNKKQLSVGIQLNIQFTDFLGNFIPIIVALFYVIYMKIPFIVRQYGGIHGPPVAGGWAEAV